VHLPCGDAETVDWLYQSSPDEKGRFIIFAGNLMHSDFESRLNISGSTLIINKVLKDDSGVYTCIKDAGVGARYRVVLIVQGKETS